jgi:multidrug efflux pump subunit AcrA (membrane-fusion protein)
VDRGAGVPSSQSGWGRAGHRRAVLVGAVVVAVLVGASVGAWAAVSGGSTGYRTATVTRADIGTTMALVGAVQPVSDAAPSFQVGGKVATVTIAPGQAVTAGQTLATLDTTALAETVSSAQSTLSADEAKLVEDEQNQSSAASTSNAAPRSSATPSTSTTVPSSGGSSAGNAAVTQAQTTLTQDEGVLNTDQQKEAADLAQAQSVCTSAKTGTPTGQATCEVALQAVSADEQQVSKDQGTVSKDEAALAQALGASSGDGSSSGSPGGGGSGNSGSSPTQTGHAASAGTTAAVLTAAITGNSGAGATSGGTGGTGGSGSSGNTDTPEQIASDQAAIDTAEAQLTNAQQSLHEATLTSPIAGTVVSVGISVGDTVSADSSTEIITVIGTKSYEVQATLDSSQIPSVKVGQSATVQVDGAAGALKGTVSQVGPVQSGQSGYSYPVVVSLPATAGGVYTGATASVNISTGTVSNVVAVPTSAVQTVGSTSHVLVLDNGALTRKAITIGMVGDEYTQVLSGLTPGQSVVLADYAEPVPSSNTDTNTLGGLGGGGFFGGGGGGFPGGGFRISRAGAGGFAG